MKDSSHEFYGGHTTYGEGIGIVVADTRRPRPPGDIGNATTFEFPVRFAVLAETRSERAGQEGRPLVVPFLKAVEELEAAGVLAIATSCGFLAPFQQELASAAHVPLYTTSLVQLPLVYEMFDRSGRIGVIAAESAPVEPGLLQALGAEDIPLAVAGLEEAPGFRAAVLEDRPELDFDLVQAEVQSAARRLVEAHPDVRALVLESAALPPYAAAVQEATGLPVFDLVTLSNMVYSAIRAQIYPLPSLKFGKAWWRAPW